MSGLLDGKVAIVTGGSKGIGYSIAERFTNEGAKVIICSRNDSELSEAAAKIGCESYQLDVSDSKGVKLMVEWFSKKHGQLDILVNNAGILMDGTLVKMEEEEFDAVINVNLKGVYLCGRGAATIMKEQGSGVILNASSVVAHNGNYGQTNYVATKAGVVGMTKVWARELGKDGIRVNAIAPGFITTEMTAQMPEKIIKMMSEKVPVKRWGEPEDVANAYCFLASDEASYISGMVLNVDGGVVV